MDNIHCDGNETEIKHCRFDGWGTNDCEASEAAGVVCKGSDDDDSGVDGNKHEKTKAQLKKATKHLLSKKYDIELRLTGGRNKYEGQVEVSFSKMEYFYGMNLNGKKRNHLKRPNYLKTKKKNSIKLKTKREKREKMGTKNKNFLLYSNRFASIKWWKKATGVEFAVMVGRY